MTSLRERPLPLLGPEHATRGRRARLSAAAATALPTVVLAWHQSLYGRWIVDDAAITFAYARSIATGAGPVLQPGAEEVEGWSNPAWLAVLVVARWLGLFDRGAWFGVPDLVLLPKALALVLCASMFAAFFVICRAVRVPAPGVVTAGAGVAVAGVPSFAIWTTSGLENPLLAAAAVWLAAVLARAATREQLGGWDVATCCGLLAALAALTRPDGLVYVAAYPIAVLLLFRGRSSRAATAVAVSLVVFAVPVGLYLWWRMATFGMWLPNTALAKAQSTPGLEDLQRPSQLVAYGGWLLTVVAVGLVGAALAAPGRARTGLVAVLTPLGLALVAYAVLEADWMGEHRFATPVWPLAAVATAAAAAVVLPGLAARARVIAVAVGLVAATVSGVAWAGAAERFRATPTTTMCATAQVMGATVNEFGRILGVTSGRIATPDIGGAALSSRYQVLDLGGLTSPVVARFWRDQDMAGLRDHVLDEVRPEFIELHGGWATASGLLDDPRMDAGWVPILKVRETAGWWVRRDLATPQGLAAATAHAQTVGMHWRGHYMSRARRSSCGETLTPSVGPVLA